MDSVIASLPARNVRKQLSFDEINPKCDPAVPLPLLCSLGNLLHLSAFGVCSK